jgi:hypothetical protein
MFQQNWAIFFTGEKNGPILPLLFWAIFFTGQTLSSRPVKKMAQLKKTQAVI